MTPGNDFDLSLTDTEDGFQGLFTPDFNLRSSLKFEHEDRFFDETRKPVVVHRDDGLNVVYPAVQVDPGNGAVVKSDLPVRRRDRERLVQNRAGKLVPVSEHQNIGIARPFNVQDRRQGLDGGLVLWCLFFFFRGTGMGNQQQGCHGPQQGNNSLHLLPSCASSGCWNVTWKPRRTNQRISLKIAT